MDTERIGHSWECNGFERSSIGSPTLYDLLALVTLLLLEVTTSDRGS
jgi:hypothetical protein